MLSHPSLRPPMRGFQLIELLIVVVICSILYAVAAPNFSAMLADHRVRTAAAGILNGLQLARAEAIRRNTDVQFTLEKIDDKITGGWTVAVVNPVSLVQTATAGEAGQQLSIASLQDQTSVRFNSQGHVRDYDIAKTLSRVNIEPPSDSAASTRLQIDVYAGGQLRLCKSANASATDPGKC